jgi:hypothetical protein
VGEVLKRATPAVHWWYCVPACQSQENGDIATACGCNMQISKRVGGQKTRLNPEFIIRIPEPPLASCMDSHRMVWLNKLQWKNVSKSLQVIQRGSRIDV